MGIPRILRMGMDSGVFPWFLSARNARCGEAESSESLLSETPPAAKKGFCIFKVDPQFCTACAQLRQGSLGGMKLKTGYENRRGETGKTPVTLFRFCCENIRFGEGPQIAN
eukprot:1175444-Prorocentrum_minimum.AAC.2